MLGYWLNRARRHLVRCQATHFGLRCEERADHDGGHYAYAGFDVVWFA